ncbi:MAG: hypothetical protein RLY96_548 [Actinomycetota bacterium]
MTTEIEPVRSNSPELAAMTLPKLKTVATQLGVDGAGSLIYRRRTAKLQRLNAKHVAKRATTARRSQSLQTTLKIQMMMAMMIQRRSITVIGQTMTVVEMIVTTVVVALIVTTVVVDVTATAIATVTVGSAKSASRSLAKMMFSFQ